MTNLFIQSTLPEIALGIFVAAEDIILLRLNILTAEAYIKPPFHQH